MASDIVEKVKAAGVVGAGGAGFPTHVKLSATVDTVIANGAECEPLLHADQHLMARYPEVIVRGLRLAMQATGAERGIVALKAEYEEATAALQRALDGNDKVSLHLLGNFYPSGDEFVLVYDVLARVVPEGGIPLEVGVVVNNVGTLFNVARAAEDISVTHRYLTVTDIAEMGQYTFGNLPGWENLPEKVKPGDIVITGSNFGCGSSRQQAVDCFASLGVALIIAKSFGAIYERNAINAGTPIMLADLSDAALKNGDEIEVDLTTGEITHVASGKAFTGRPFSEVQIEIYQRGGLLEVG